MKVAGLDRVSVMWLSCFELNSLRVHEMNRIFEQFIPFYRVSGVSAVLFFSSERCYMFQCSWQVFFPRGGGGGTRRWGVGGEEHVFPNPSKPA